MDESTKLRKRFERRGKLREKRETDEGNYEMRDDDMLEDATTLKNIHIIYYIVGPGPTR